MSETAAAAAVIVVLKELGLETWQAEQAAGDPLLVWTEDALVRCVQSVVQSTADRPAAVLWSALSKRHAIPGVKHKTPLRLVTEDAPYVCPVCKADFAVCKGMHGWAATFRGMTPGEIFSE
jgi:hypothetical protein